MSHSTTTKRVAVTLRKSPIAQPGKIKKVVAGLGLRKMHHTVILQATPQVMGMVNKVTHLVEVREIA